MQFLLQALTYHRYSDEPTSVIVILVVRVTLVVATGWLVSRGLSTSSAAVAHRVWLLTILGMLVVPVVWALTPAWRVPLVAVHVQGTAWQAGTPAVSVGSAWPDVLVAAWIVGTCVGVCYMVLGIISARQLFRTSRPCVDMEWLGLLESVRRETGLARRVELRITERSMSPAVWSFWRVEVLLPAQSRSWPLAQRRNVLVHELAHVARHDCATQMFANLACAVWWFHPLAWFAARQLRTCGELAADDFVIRGGRGRADYAAQLLAIAGSLGWSRLPAAAQTMFHPSHLEKRLRAILDPARRRDALDGRRSLAGVAAAAVLVIPLAMFTPSRVRAVADPPQAGQPVSVDVYLKMRVTVPPTPTPQQKTFEFRTSESPALPVSRVPPQAPPGPPPATIELIPNWEKGEQADRLIPNHVPGTSQVYLVEAQPMPPAGGDVALPPEELAELTSAAQSRLFAAHSAPGAAAAAPVASPAPATVE